MASPFVIPGDVIRLIFSHLGLVELGRACRAGKRLKTLLYPVIENRHLYMRLGKKEILLYIISMITEANEFEISLLWIPLQVWTIRFNTVNEKYTLNTCSEAYSPRKRDKKFYLIETKREVCLLITRLLETTRYCISTDLATLRLLYDRRVQYGVESRKKAICYMIQNVVNKTDTPQKVFYREALLNIREKAGVKKKHGKHIQEWFNKLLTDPYTIPEMSL